MTTQTLTPTTFVPDGPGLNITALLATPTGVTLQFNNSGLEMLLVLPGAGSEIATVDFGTTVLGQAVANFSSVTMTSTDLYAFGPFHSVLDQPGGTTIQVTLSTITSIQVALVRAAAVY